MQLGSRAQMGLGGFSRLAAPCVTFDGINDFIVVPDNTALDISTNLTVCVWAKSRAKLLSNIKTILSKIELDAFYENEWVLYVYDDYVKFLSSGDGSTQNIWTSNSTVENIDRWNHYAFVFQGGVSLKCYVNAVETPGSFTSGSLPSSLYNGAIDLRIGGLSSTTILGFDGQLCDPRIYGSSLSSTDIRNIYEGRTVGSPAAWYPLNEGSGSVANDVSGNGNNGTLTNFNLTNAWANTQDVFYYA